MDIKPLVDFMKDSLKRYGFWRFTLAMLLAIVCWRLPDIMTALSLWR